MPTPRRVRASSAEQAAPSTVELLRAFGKVGCLGFGGPAGQAALLQRVVVEERRWLDARSYADGLALCTVLPGPEAMQLATWIGWRVAGARGAAIAALLFVLPGAGLVWLVAATWAAWSQAPASVAIAAGLRCAVVCLLCASVLQLVQSLQVRGRAAMLGLAAAALALPPIANVPLALLVGALGGVAMLRATDATPPSPRRTSPADSDRVGRGPRWAGLVLLAVAWILPLVLLVAWQGGRVAELARALGELALFGFGGAYTMVAWFGGTAVHEGWVAPPMVAEALGVAEATPGPLVLALQFLSHQALAATPGSLSPLAAGTLGSLLALWSIFLPSALWVLAAAGPYERLRSAPLVAPAFAGVRAASLGVLLALGVQLAEATWWVGGDSERHIDYASLATCAMLGAWLAWRRLAPSWVLAAGILLRVALEALAGA
jgi:chromate transporter